MTETLVEYRVAGKVNHGVTWRRCPKCNVIYGYEIEGGKYLRVGKMKVKFIKADCGDCDNTIWWASTDRHMRNIERRMKNRK